MSLKAGSKYICPAHHYKGFMIMSPGKDYHFARQDNRMIKVYRKMHKDKVNIYHKKVGEIYLYYIMKEIPEIVELAHKVYPKSMHYSSDIHEKLKSIYKCSRTWSHKRGGSLATDKDASGNLILDPSKADWDYSKEGSLNYNVKCCYFSIPSNYKSKTYSTGVPNNMSGNAPKNNANNVRTNLSTDISIDAKYEKMLKKVCRL